MTTISKHLSYSAATKSQTAIKNGISNEPNLEQLNIMRVVAFSLFEPLRIHHGKPIKVTSMFRSVALNSVLGGSTKSQHLYGALSGLREGAIDIDMDVFNNGMSNCEAFMWLYYNLEFDQLIWEFGTLKNPNWVHVSYRENENRKQVLRAHRGAQNKTIYSDFNPDLIK